MKITKTSIEVKLEQDKYKEAHYGCEKCPCCNEADVLARKMELESDLANHISMKYYMADSLVILGSHVYELRDDGSIGSCIDGNRFIKKLPSEEYTKRGVRYRIDKYRCRICGCEWESDPYDSRLDPNKVNNLSDDEIGDDVGLIAFYVIFLIVLPILGLLALILS